MSRLNDDQRKRLEELYCFAKEHRNNYVSQIAKLALDLDRKGEYEKFEAAFGEDYMS